MHRIKEEEEKRKEISNRFQVAIDDINQQMSTNTERNGTLIQENTQLTNKLKTLLEQYEKREEVYFTLFLCNKKLNMNLIINIIDFFFSSFKFILIYIFINNKKAHRENPQTQRLGSRVG